MLFNSSDLIYTEIWIDKFKKNAFCDVLLPFRKEVKRLILYKTVVWWGKTIATAAEILVE